MTEIAEEIAQVRFTVESARARRQSIGFVPTMGALHAGHARLIERCREEARFTVVSLFVNPTQFGPNEDFTSYPRTWDEDLCVASAAGADLLFRPSVEAMYPSGRLSTYVEPGSLSTVLEGRSRPGHFRGVATVVLKLFQIVQPDFAYFGEKDYQQLLVIRRIVDDLNVPVAVRSVPTVREPDGLAMSSRNRYLSPAERQAALVLSRALGAARDVVLRGEHDANRIRQTLAETVKYEQLAELDYAEVADAGSLEPLVEIETGRRAVALLAVRIGGTRLIDNAILME
ncbi:MAG: pantoate--beta-alanine ligase [Isosphaeraceae bacterium]|nr:pantoate--beta-alanine ligase [Isosphaeraceae bacterium]